MIFDKDCASGYLNKKHHFDNMNSNAVVCLPLKREVRGSNLMQFNLSAVLPMARHCCGIFLKGAVLPGRNDAERGSSNLLHVSARQRV